MDLNRMPLRHADKTQFSKVWNLYEEAFPVMERRELSLQLQILKNPIYHAELFFSEGELLGFLFWWHLGSVRFVEHLAVAESFRGKGIGREMLEWFLQESADLHLLEVEPPLDETGRQRIRFYERIGFRMNAFSYRQLPMRMNGQSVELLLMSFPRKLEDADVRSFNVRFQRNCYDPYFS